MKIYNTIDDKLRFCGFKATDEQGVQADSHTVSYLYAREQLTYAGMVMGFDSLPQQTKENNYERKPKTN